MKEEVSKIDFVTPRATVEVIMPNGKVLRGPRGACVGEFMAVLEEKTDLVPIVGALINGELRELTYSIDVDSRVEPVTMSDEDGMRIYRRSLTFLLETAFTQLFPGTTLTIDHSVAAGGYFCQVSRDNGISSEQLSRVEVGMRELVEENIPLIKEKVPLDEAIAYFEAHGYMDKVQLLKHRKKDYLVLYRLADHRDYHHGYMVPSTGYLKWFALQSTNGDFTLRFPRRANPTTLTPLPDYPKMLAAFRRYGSLLERLGIDSVGALNDAILEDRIREIIMVSEALHEQRIAEIAGEIASKREAVRVVLIAGPSSSGKTTSAKRISVQLLARGISPFPLELDNYFLPRLQTPRDELGEYDFESIDALNRERLNRDLKKLIAGEVTQLPKYNFITGKVEKGDIIQLRPGQIIIIEGIHGLHPKLIPEIPSEQTFRIYLSALTQLNLDRHNRVSTTDTRLVRRIVRDARERGYSAQTTIQRWESVRRGEKENIFPYQENCDAMFNSALVYELAALKPYAEPLLRQVPYKTPEFVEAKRLLALLGWVLPIDREIVPDNSLLREFLGGSILKDFIVWHHA